MLRQEATPATDALLAPLLRAEGAAESERLLAALIGEHAEPIIRRIIRRKLRADAHGDGEDLRADVLVQLLSRLAELKSDPRGGAIQNFRSYVAVTTYRACADFLRRSTRAATASATSCAIS